MNSFDRQRQNNEAERNGMRSRGQKGIREDREIPSLVIKVIRTPRCPFWVAANTDGSYTISESKADATLFDSLGRARLAMESAKRQLRPCLMRMVDPETDKVVAWFKDDLR
jgi:hypothetical protein